MADPVKAPYSPAPKSSNSVDITKVKQETTLGGRISTRDGCLQGVVALDELRNARSLYWAGEFHRAQAILEPLWEGARCRGDGQVALLMGETYYGLGEYDQAQEWYRQAFSTDPGLELTGRHSMPFILRDLGFLDRAEDLARRCVAACTGRDDQEALAYAKLQYAWLCADQGRFAEARAEMCDAERIGLASGEPLIGLLAMLHRAGVASLAGNATEYRQIAEQAYTLLRGRSPWVEALAGFILAGVLFAWGDGETATRLMLRSLEVLTRLDSKFMVHMLLSIMAGAAWRDGRRDDARKLFDRSIALAGAQGYLYILVGERYLQLPLVVDALVRGVEIAHCQRALVHTGSRALPHLLAMAGNPDPAAREAALYPLAALGGDEAVAAIRRLAHDGRERVRDRALLALKSMGLPESAPSADDTPAADGRVRVEVTLLGPITVSVDRHAVSGWRTAKSRDLLAFLLLGGDRPFTREQLAEALWPGGDPEASARTLHTVLHHLRRSLGPGAEPLVAFVGGAYRLCRDDLALDVDLERFQRQAATEDEAAWRAAVALYRGDLLEGLDYPWCDAPRTRVRGLYLGTLRKLAALLERQSRWADAAEFFHLLVQADPLDEDGHVGLMTCYAAQGNRSAAMAQYRTLATLLDEELGLSPGRRAESLYQQLLE